MEKMKKCSKCRQEKSISSFYLRKSRSSRFPWRIPYLSPCKSCQIDSSKKQGKTEYRKLSIKKYQQLNRPSIRVKRREHQKVYQKTRYTNNLQFRLTCLLRARLRMAINGNFNGGLAIKYLGCSVEELKMHLEKQFRENMSWNNRKKWHIDHIVPLSSANTETDIIKLSHYSNLQPLWASENESKGNKILT